MSIKEVTMYQVCCDADDCAECTGSNGDGYVAWADAGQAVDDWNDASGVTTADGTHLCFKHSGRVCLECGHEGDPGFISEHDMCENCYND